jgi:hypothetical protein
MAQESGIHHFSLFVRGGTRKPIGESVIDGQRVVHCLFGGADFNFFTGEGLKRVGGWHPCFAEYRRFGHTEHSYRFFRTGLAPAPFNVAEELDNACMWHFHPSVSSGRGVVLNEDQIALPERTLIDAGLEHVEVQTISPHHFNDVSFGELDRLVATLAPGERYPLIGRADRREARSDYYLWTSETARTFNRRVLAFVAAAYNWPSNPALRHMVKTALRMSSD